MTFTRGQEVTVSYSGWHFTALYFDSRAGGRSCGLNVADHGTSPFAPGRFVTVPMRCVTAREPEPSRQAEAAGIAAQILGQYGFTAEDIREGIAEGGSISVSYVTPEPVLSEACGLGLPDFCGLCREPSCTHSCHGGKR